MDNLENKKNKKTPPEVYVVIPMGVYFLYQAYNRFIVEEYMFGGFFVLVSTVLLITAYLVYKKSKI